MATRVLGIAYLHNQTMISVLFISRSNCVINLCKDKAVVLEETFNVLKVIKNNCTHRAHDLVATLNQRHRR